MLVREDGPTMFYGTHFIMSPPAKSKLKRQGQLLSSVLSRTLSYKYRDLDTTCSSLGTSDDPAELSTQLSAPGVLKVFGDSVCTGTHYKSVLATGTSSARELVREALERYALSPERAGQYVLCDVVGQAGDSGRQWQAEGFRVFGDNEKPLLIQELWKPREGLSRRFELRKRSEMEELAARDVDTVTAGEEGREEARGGRRSGKHRAGVLLRRPVGLCRGGAQDGLFSLLCGAVCRAPAGGHSALLTASCSAVGRFLLSVEDGRPGGWHACHWPQRGPCPVQAAHAVQKAPQCPRRRGNLRGKRTRRRWRKRVSGGAMHWGARRGSGGRAGSSAEPLPGAGALQALRDAALLTRRKEAHCLNREAP